MPDRNPSKEIGRIRNLLVKMAETAEHAEQTGSFENGLRNYVKRYNAIVEHLEDENLIPEDLFSQLDENETSFGELGAESTLLADYISDAVEETPEQNSKKAQKEGLGPLIALAPFLGSTELSKLVRERLGVSVTVTSDQPTPAPKSEEPDLKTLVALAPHLDSNTLGELVSAALKNRKITDPSILTALAPHMNSKDLGKLVREQMPNWFGNQSSEAQPAEAAGEQQYAAESWSVQPTSPTPPAHPTPPPPPARPEELR